MDERVAIQELTRLYALYCDTHAYQNVASLFTNDCVYDEAVVGGRPVKTRSEVLQLFLDASKKLGPMMHICTNQIITEFSGRTASGLCYVLAEGIFYMDGTEKPFRIFGYYDDRYSKEGDRWYFKSRVLRLLVPSQGAPTFGGISYDTAATHFTVRE